MEKLAHFYGDTFGSNGWIFPKKPLMGRWCQVDTSKPDIPRILTWMMPGFVRINGLFHSLINRVFLGVITPAYQPLIRTNPGIIQVGSCHDPSVDFISLRPNSLIPWQTLVAYLASPRTFVVKLPAVTLRQSNIAMGIPLFQ